MAVLGHHTSDSDAVPSQPLIQNGGRIVDYGQRNSLKTINVDGEHFIRFRGKSCVFKFILLSVDVAKFSLFEIRPSSLLNFGTANDKPMISPAKGRQHG